VPSDQELKAAKEIVLSLLKAQKTVRIYPENSPVREKSVDEVLAKFGEFFQLRDALDFWIRPNEILLGSVPVYHNVERTDNLAFFFFKDGLKQLSFRRDLTREELADFLMIITTDFDRHAADDDVVTLLWERDFEHIKHLTDETFVLEDDTYEAEATVQVAEKSSTFEQISEAYREGLEGDEVNDTPIVTLTDKDLRSLVHEIERDSEEKKSEKLSRILFEMLYQAAEQAERDDVLRFFREFLVHTMKQGDMELLISITKEAREASEAAGHSDNVRMNLEMLSAVISSAEIINAMGEMFDSAKDMDEGLFNAYAELLSKEAIGPLIPLLGQLETIHGRKRVIALLTRLGHADIKPLVRALGDQRWYLVRNVVCILRGLGDKAAEPHLIAMMRHADMRVRREVVKTLGEFRTVNGLAALRESLNDGDSLVRRLVARALADIGSDSAKKYLLEHLQGKEFPERDFEERKEFYGALARWRDNDVVGYLSKVVTKRSLFKKTREDEDKACAAYCLGLMGSPEAKELLAALQDTKSPVVREHVHEALRALERPTRGG
jgi:hypothetical protein